MWTEYSFPGDFEIIKKGKSDFFCLYLPPISYEVKRLKETVFYDKPSLFGLRVKFNMANISSANSTNVTNVTSLIIINTITCPFTVLLNLLVIKAVKSTPRLRTNSNILLPCLAVTDALTGLLGQRLFVLWKIFLFFGLSDSGTVEGCYTTTVIVIITASYFHLILVTLERLVAVKKMKRAVLVAWILAFISGVFRVLKNVPSCTLFFCPSDSFVHSFPGFRLLHYVSKKHVFNKKRLKLNNCPNKKWKDLPERTRRLKEQYL